MSREASEPNRWFGRVAREPLLWFLVLGGLAYLLWSGLAPQPIETIVIDPETVRLLEAQREELLGRPLGRAERARIRESLIEDEILLREARRRELDRLDPRARERLLRVMRASLEKPLAEPTRAELEAHFEQHLDRFWDGEELELEYVFFPHGSSATPDDPEAFVATLEEDRFVVPQERALGLREDLTASPREIRSALGSLFADQVLALTPGGWHGPITSPAGLHYMRLIERRALPRPALDNILFYVRQDWEAESRREDLRRGIEGFETRSRIVIVDD